MIRAHHAGVAARRASAKADLAKLVRHVGRLIEREVVIAIRG